MLLVGKGRIFSGKLSTSNHHFKQISLAFVTDFVYLYNLFLRLYFISKIQMNLVVRLFCTIRFTFKKDNRYV